MPQESRSGGHIQALDGLRGVAIALVICSHTLIPGQLGGDPVTRGIRAFFGIGWIGVDLFFVLSGMLITGILLDTKGGDGYFRSFYARRTLRIFPLYYAALVVFLLIVPRVGGHLLPNLTDTHGAAWVVAYLTNVRVSMTEHWSSVPDLAGPLWSLAVEEQFYLVWPLVVWLTTRRQLVGVAFAVIVIATALRLILARAGGHELANYTLLPTRMDTLAIGGLVAVLARSERSLVPWRRLAAYACCACALVFVGIVLRTNDPSNRSFIMQTLGFSLAAVGSAALLVRILTADKSRMESRFFCSAPLCRLGARSYAVYVWHALYVHLGRALHVSDYLPQVGRSNVPGMMVLAGFVLAAAWLTAEVSWRVLEAPCLALKRYVPRPHAAVA